MHRLKIGVDPGCGKTGVADAVQKRTGTVHEVTTGKNSSNVGHEVDVDSDSAPMIESQAGKLACSGAGRRIKSKRDDNPVGLPFQNPPLDPRRSH